jgi:formate/nitrite transporter FocA (FNT family)
MALVTPLMLKIAIAMHNAGMYIEVEAKFTLMLQTLFTLKQKHAWRAWLLLSINCNIFILLDISSVRDDTSIH